MVRNPSPSPMTTNCLKLAEYTYTIQIQKDKRQEVVGHIHVAGLSGDVRHGGGAGASHQAAFPLAAVHCLQV